MVEGILTHLYLIPKLMPFITSYPNVPFMLHKCQHLSQPSAQSEPILYSEQMGTLAPPWRGGQCGRFAAAGSSAESYGWVWTHAVLYENLLTAQFLEMIDFTAFYKYLL